jgi:hypothetical protein
VAFGLLLAYVVVAVLTPWGRLRAGYVRRHAAAARALVLAGLAEVTIFSRSLGALTDRLRWHAPATFIHDTALQVEISASALLQRHNPYTISFLDTPLRQLYEPPGQKVALRPDLPLTHNPHLPLGFLLSAPAQFLFSRLLLLFDERYLYLLALLAVALSLPLLVRVPARQLAQLRDGLVVDLCRHGQRSTPPITGSMLATATITSATWPPSHIAGAHCRLVYDGSRKCAR